MAAKRSGIAFVDVATGDYLLVRVSASGKWGFPKGAVEEGETELHAALREFREETGANIRLEDGTDYVVRSYLYDDTRIFKIEGNGARMRADIYRNPLAETRGEIEDVRFTSVDKIRTLPVSYPILPYFRIRRTDASSSIILRDGVVFTSGGEFLLFRTVNGYYTFPAVRHSDSWPTNVVELLDSLGLRIPADVLMNTRNVVTSNVKYSVINVPLDQRDAFEASISFDNSKEFTSYMWSRTGLDQGLASIIRAIAGK